MSRRSLASKITIKIMTSFYRRLFFVVRQLDEPIPSLQSQLPVQIRLLQKTEVDDYLRFRPQQKRRQIQDRLAAGHQCHASWYKGQIVDAAWCATGYGPVPYLGRQLVLAADEVFIFDAYTSPPYRGYNLFMAKFAHIFRTTRDAGYRRNSGVVAVENKTSMTILRRLGCEAIGLYSSIGLGPWRIVWKRPFCAEPLPLLCAARSINSER